jgi:acetyltransferase-like isoleucine patch superfamily enzyme
LKQLATKILLLIFKKIRIFFYSFISERKISGVKIQPVFVKGVGNIDIADNVTFGVERSPQFFSSYIYLDVRRESSKIAIGKNTYINNNASIISDGCTIKIGENCLFGTNLQIIDSDFHDLDPRFRFGGANILKADVIINNNVFMGNNVTVLKGVTIGENSVIANGSIVSSSIPANVIAAGIPAKPIRDI